MMSVYRRNVTSTHGGNSIVLECSAVIAWSGLGAVVDTAIMTAFAQTCTKRATGDRADVPATG